MIGRKTDQPYPVRLFLAGVFTINRAAQRTLPPRPNSRRPVRYWLSARLLRRMREEIP